MQQLRETLQQNDDDKIDLGDLAIGKNINADDDSKVDTLQMISNQNTTLILMARCLRAMSMILLRIFVCTSYQSENAILFVAMKLNCVVGDFTQRLSISFYLLVRQLEIHTKCHVEVHFRQN